MLEITCTSCKKPYPDRGLPYLCPQCGGIFEWTGLPDFRAEDIEPNLPGIWRYWRLFGNEIKKHFVSLGEGNTPLIPGNAFGKRVGWKLEYINPTGSYKDRGSAVLMGYIKSRGVDNIVEDSSGNAGASFAAYASRAGVKSRVYVPKNASGPKLRQIESYGSELVVVDGPRSAAARAVLKDVAQGHVYGSHAYLPFGMLGNATIAYELLAEMDTLPGTIIAPVGHGSLLLGVINGFEILKQSGAISHIPAYVGVQAAACAPIWAEFTGNKIDVKEGETLAEGVRVKQPVRSQALLRAMHGKDDRFVLVEEDQILSGRDALARQGFYVEPTSAIVWNAFQQIASKVPEPVVVLLTGSGFKYQDR